MSIRTKLFDKGRLVEEQMVRFLVKLDKRVSDLEEGEGTAYDDTEVKADISALETAIGDESTEGSILARIKALEDAQTPDDPSSQEMNSYGFKI